MGSCASQDVFISYSRQDASLAQKLADHLRSQIGFTVFIDTSMRNGDVWPEILEAKLNSVAAVVVLWSKHSVVSDWVLEEARYGKSRQVLVAARIDNCELPFGYRRYHTDELQNWTDVGAPAGLSNVVGRVKELVDAARGAVVAGAPVKRETNTAGATSISKQELDKEAIIFAISHNKSAVESVENGYSELQNAYDTRKSVVDNLQAAPFFAAAAEHFSQALAALGNDRLRIARNSRGVEYFLMMERANALVETEPARDERDDPIAEAIQIYTTLSRSHLYKNDVPVYFRLGRALVRQSRLEESVVKAIQRLDKARKLARDAHEAGDALVKESSWINVEIAKMLGLCNYYMSELPAFELQRTQVKRKKRFLDVAISETRDAVELIPKGPGNDEPLDITAVYALGNLAFYLAQRLRNGDGNDTDKQEIRATIAKIKAPNTWEVAQNQTEIVDDIAFAAATVGDWELALEEAERNIEYLAAIKRRKDDEIAMLARAKEIRFFAASMLDAAGRPPFT